MQQDLFTSLIEKYLAGKASRQEIHLLEEYYTRMGRKDTQHLSQTEAAEIKNDIFSELQARVHASGEVRASRVFPIHGKWWAVAAILCLVAGVAVFFMLGGDKKDNSVTPATATVSPVIPAHRIIQNNKKNVFDTLLPDGTHVWLKADATIQYSSVFAANERRVELTGEAYFDVVHNASQPFKVQAGATLIEDIGTRFNVNAYPGKPVKVTLIEGVVKVNGIQLVPGQQYADGKIKRVNASAAIAWMDEIKENEDIVIAKFPTESSVTLENFMTADFGKIKSLYLLDDSTLITAHTQPMEGDYFFNQYSLNTKSVTAKYIKSPGGPGVTLASFSGMHRKNTLWLYDLSSQHILSANIKREKEASEIAPRTFRLSRYYYNIQMMDSLKVAANGSMALQHEIQETELAWSKETADYGNLRPTPKGIPFTAWKDAHQSFLFLKPSEEKIVSCARFTDELQIYDRRTQKAIRLRGPENFEPAFETSKVEGWNLEVMVRNSKTRIAFQSGAVTEKYIYLLYSGNPDEVVYVPDSKTRGAGKYIYVFDWNGHPVKKINLDRLITGFTVSDDNKTLYATHSITNPKIIYKTKISL